MKRGQENNIKMVATETDDKTGSFGISDFNLGSITRDLIKKPWP
jgi:hypothetical protein